jgi:hypothetical protein
MYLWETEFSSEISKPQVLKTSSTALGAVYTYTRFPVQISVPLLQVGWQYDSLYDKKLQRVDTIRIGVRIPVRFRPLQVKEGKKDISRKRNAKMMFPKKLNRVQFRMCSELYTKSYSHSDLCTNLK